MNRSDCHAALSALLDEWLNPSLDSERRQEVRREVERVISQYPEGESEWRGLLELENTLRAMPTVSAPPRIRSNVRAALTAETAPRPRRIWSLNALTWVGSATFAMFVLWIVARPLSNQPPLITAPVQQESLPTARPTLDPKRPNPTAKNQSGGSAKNAGPAKTPKAAIIQGKTAPSKPTPQNGSLAAPQRAVPQFAPQSEDRAQEKQSAQNSNSASGLARNAKPESADSSPRLGQQNSREMAPSLTRPKALESRPAGSGNNEVKAATGRMTQPSISGMGDGFSAGRATAPRLAMPAPKSSEPANLKTSPMRLRSARPDMDSNQAQVNYDDDWARTNVTFTLVTLPANRGFLPAPALGAAPTADMARNVPSATLARPLPPRARAVSPMRAAPIEAPGADTRAQETAPIAGAAPTLKAAPPAPSIVVPSAPKPEIAPAPIAPPTESTTQENGARVFTVPPTSPRRFRVTIQTPRTLGPARARLEGDGVPPNSAPIWQGTLEEQRPVTIETEAIVTPGERLNLVVEQIRPNGESGEQKTFPLVRP